MDNPTTKRCRQCKQEYPLSAEYFYVNKRERDGLFSTCKSCHNKRRSEHMQQNPELHEEVKRQQRERQKQRRIDDPTYREKQNKKQREYERERRANPELRQRDRQQSRERYANTPELREKNKQYAREWIKTDRGRLLKKTLKSSRRARDKNAEGFHTIADIETQYRAQKNKCWHCGKPLNGKFHVDHLIPLKKGGTNWPNNIVCSCAKCNHSKGAKYTYEWNGKLF